MITQRLVDRFGDSWLPYSALADEALCRAVLCDLIERTGPIRHIVETGTFRGWSAALLAEYADHVTTFDVQYFHGCEAAWATLGVLDKITFREIRDDQDKADILAGLDFDAAFVDGCHIGGVAVDFGLLRPAGRLIFHDYTPGFPPDNLRTHVLEFVDGIDRTDPAVILRRPPFATWIDAHGPHSNDPGKAGRSPA